MRYFPAQNMLAMGCDMLLGLCNRALWNPAIAECSSISIQREESVCRTNRQTDEASTLWSMVVSNSPVFDCLSWRVGLLIPLLHAQRLYVQYGVS